MKDYKQIKISLELYTYLKSVAKSPNKAIQQLVEENKELRQLKSKDLVTLRLVVDKEILRTLNG